MDNGISIYALVDPRDQLPHYIGKAEDAKKRYLGHMSTYEDSPKWRWIKALKAVGLRPGLVILDVVEPRLWEREERDWILGGFAHGWPLTNIQYRTSGITHDQLEDIRMDKYKNMATDKGINDFITLLAERIELYCCLCSCGRWFRPYIKGATTIICGKCYERENLNVF